MNREPTDDRKRRGSAMSMSLGLFVMLIGGYLGAYFTFGQRGTWLGVATRTFEGERFARVFIPAAWLESKVTRKHMCLCFSGSKGGIRYFNEIYTAKP